MDNENLDNINELDEISVEDFFDSVDSWEMLLSKKCTADTSNYSSNNRNSSCTFT